MKYENDARSLLEYVGGKENVAALTHCVTRMRFVLKDPSIADEESIEKLASVKGTFTQAGQYQVIIGNDVQTFYNDFIKVSGIEGMSKDEAKSAGKQNMSLVQRAVASLAEIFAPIIPAIIVGGLLLGFRNVLDGIPFSAWDGQTIVEVSQFWKGVNDFLWLICEAIFHFLPVGITWSVTKKMGTTQILGIILGITLVSPQLLNAYGVATTAAAEIPKWDFGFFQINMIGYQAQVLPAMFAAFLLVYLERFFRKVIPDAVSMIFVPLFSLVPTVIAAHVVLGPIGWKIGSAVSTAVSFGLASSFNWAFGALFGFLYAPLVITGLHHMILAVDLQLVADVGYTNIWPMVALSNIAQGSAVFAMVILHRKNKDVQQVAVPSTISAFLGVTEPAMFGVNLKYLYPFIAAMIGSGIAGFFAQLLGVKAAGVGIGGLPGIISMRAGSYLTFLFTMVVAVVVPFVLTIIFEKRGIFVKGEKITD